ncbi:hypothetical protein AVEN_229350-1 [Araneus ventricosus]|uniref:Uncharacterized protein n=1 Tax=Araneus ventricosus TaxID=182803 RepID=A0A4Y2W164_ARAVE|nr:hypothetical protein AVEN_229350-1 [Araneus ventricosus]
MSIHLLNGPEAPLITKVTPSIFQAVVQPFRKAFLALFADDRRRGVMSPRANKSFLPVIDFTVTAKNKTGVVSLGSGVLSKEHSKCVETFGRSLLPSRE